MNFVPLSIGVGVVLSASFINHQIAVRFNGSLGAWYGWVTATIVRFSAIIFGGFYVLLAGQGVVDGTVFMLTLLGVLFTGLILDLFFSLFRLNHVRYSAERKVGL